MRHWLPVLFLPLLFIFACSSDPDYDDNDSMTADEYEMFEETTTSLSVLDEPIYTDANYVFQMADGRLIECVSWNGATLDCDFDHPISEEPNE